MTGVQPPEAPLHALQTRLHHVLDTLTDATLETLAHPTDGLTLLFESLPGWTLIHPGAPLADEPLGYLHAYDGTRHVAILANHATFDLATIGTGHRAAKVYWDHPHDGTPRRANGHQRRDILDEAIDDLTYLATDIPNLITTLAAHPGLTTDSAQAQFIRYLAATYYRDHPDELRLLLALGPHPHLLAAILNTAEPNPPQPRP